MEEHVGDPRWTSQSQSMQQFEAMGLRRNAIYPEMKFERGR